MAKCCVCNANIGFLGVAYEIVPNSGRCFCAKCVAPFVDDLRTLENGENLTAIVAAKDRLADYFNSACMPEKAAMDAKEDVQTLYESRLKDESIAAQQLDPSYQAAKFPQGTDQVIGRSIMVTTTPHFEGYRIVKYHGIVSGAAAQGVTRMTDDTGFFDFGGKIRELNNMMPVREAAILHLQKRAAVMGANAVVGVDIEMCEMAGNMLAVTATGTAVTIEEV